MLKAKTLGLKLVFSLVFLFSAALLYASQYNMIKPEELKNWLTSGKKVILVDIQPHEDFVKGHIKGAIETNAFPASKDEEKKRLDKVLPIIQKSNDPVVILCPRGRTGAKNSYDYLKSKGVPENRLYILEGGMAGWPYPELLEKGK
jgi:rhodanese-related sulfurtransferase